MSFQLIYIVIFIQQLLSTLFINQHALIRHLTYMYNKHLIHSMHCCINLRFSAFIEYRMFRIPVVGEQAGGSNVIIMILIFVPDTCIISYSYTLLFNVILVNTIHSRCIIAISLD